MHSLGGVEGQLEVLPGLIGVQDGVLEGIREEAVHQGAEGDAVLPTGGEVVDVHPLQIKHGGHFRVCVRVCVCAHSPRRTITHELGQREPAHTHLIWLCFGSTPVQKHLLDIFSVWHKSHGTFERRGCSRSGRTGKKEEKEVGGGGWRGVGG